MTFLSEGITGEKEAGAGSEAFVTTPFGPSADQHTDAMQQRMPY